VAELTVVIPGELPAPGGEPVRILVDRERPVTETFGAADLPCYRGGGAR
jgi:hypothetical protein